MKFIRANVFSKNESEPTRNDRNVDGRISTYQTLAFLISCLKPGGIQLFFLNDTTAFEFLKKKDSYFFLEISGFSLSLKIRPWPQRGEKRIFCGFFFCDNISEIMQATGLFRDLQKTLIDNFLNKSILRYVN